MNRIDFVKFITTTGFVTSEDVAKIEQEAPQVVTDDANALARQLVAKEKLTKFQAAAIYQGKGKSLIFGEHVVVDRIGAGGMGQVFKARHRRMDRIVALKVMSPAAIKNADAVKRFEREVRAAAKLSHPNVVHAYDAGVHDGAFFLVMEFVEGADFSSLLKQQIKFTIKQACGYFEQAARGFAAAHAKGIIHRDVKPGNVLVDKSGVVKILDMGLARIEDDGVGAKLSEGELTQSGSVMGTIDYMAPEQALNTHHADAKSDVYGLGCTFYRILTGEPVFGGQTLIEKVLAHREHPIPSIRRLRPDAPPALDLLISRMLAKSPTDRPTMQEVADTLAALDHAAGSGDGGYSVSQEAPAPAISFPPQTFGQSLPPSTTIGPGILSKASATPKPGKKPNSALLVGVGGAAVVAVGLATWAMMKGGGEGGDGAVAAAPPGVAVGETVEPNSPAVAVTPSSIVPKPTIAATPTPTPAGGATTGGPPGVAINPRTGRPNNPPTFVGGTPAVSTPIYSGPPDEIVLDAELERRAATKVLALGGTMSVQGPNFSGRITRVSEMPNLQFGIVQIDLGKTNANDKDIEALAGLGALQSLNLSYTSVTDACLPVMASFKRLRSLTVSGAGDRITDAGLKSLEGLKDLTFFSAQDTKVTGAASRELHAKIPNCRITWSGGILEGKPVVSRGYNVSFATPQVSLNGRSSIDQAIISAGSPASVANAGSNPLGTPPTAVASSTTTSSTTTSNTTPMNSGMPATIGSATVGTTAAASTGTIASTTSTDAAAAGPKKPAVPSSADQQTALKSIKEIFADDYTAAKSFEQKKTLAGKLLDQAKQTVDDSNSRYVLLAEAKALATEASDVDTLLDVLNALAADFAVEEAAMMADAWNALLKRPRIDATTIQRIHKEATNRFDVAVGDARFDDAKQFGEFALAISRRVPNPAAATKAATERNAAVAARQKEWPALLASAEKLKKSPDDAEANLAVARYQALVAEDWKSAFPLFVKSGDELWSGLAAKSMGDLTTPTAQAGVGDAWWDAAQGAKGTLKAELSAAALYWYDLSAPLLTGLAKTRIDKRRTELGNTAVVRKIPPTSLPGFVDVALLASNTAPVGAMPNRSFGDPSPPRSSSGSTGTMGRPAVGSGDERALAQSIMAAGGTVHCRINPTTGGTSVVRVTARGVLPLEPFYIDGVSFENMNSQQEQVDEAEIAMLVGAPNLRMLSFFSCRIDERAFQHIRNLTNLENISFGSTNLRDEHLAAIRGLSKLQHVSISYCPITDAGLVHLKDLTNLRYMYLTTTQITGVGLGQLTNLQQLQSLYFFASPISDAGLLQIQRLPGLRRLDLANSAVTDAGIASLRGLNDLEFICLRGTNTGDAALQSLQGRRALKTVVVSSRVSQAAAQAFQMAIPGVRVEFPQ